MHRTVVLNVVGLTSNLLGDATPQLSRFAKRGGLRPLRPVLPALTCSVQSTFTTGLLPRDHGCIANGWYARELSEVLFWKQSNHLVGGEKIWDAARTRDADFTCAKLFWWYNMYSTADVTVTPRPLYLADGRKIPDIYTQPSALRDELTSRFGAFPLFNFWGPMADVESSRWIAGASKYVYDTRHPSLTLIYLPHLDYNLQRLGPRDARIRADLAAIDEICGELIEHFESDGARVVVLSEYGITEVRRPIHVNRTLREAGLLKVRDELGRELLDPGASDAFAVADHQVANVYVRDARRVAEVKRILESIEGVEHVLDDEGKRACGLDHPRSGELVATASRDAWFTYYYWRDDEKAPDFARTVDIHRKPGYDPAELFLDPQLRVPKAAIAWKLLKKKLGFRALLDVIPLQADLVKGSHGRLTDDPGEGPLFISGEPDLLSNQPLDAQNVKMLLLRHLFDSAASPSAEAAWRSVTEPALRSRAAMV